MNLAKSQGEIGLVNTSNQIRICVYSDSDKIVLKRALESSDYEEYRIEGLEEPKTNIYNGTSFIERCGIAKRIIPFDLKPKLFEYIDHINVIGGHYYHIAIKEYDRTSNKRKLGMIRRNLKGHGKILTDRSYDTDDIKYIEFSYEIPSSSIRYIRITFFLSILGIVLGVIGVVLGFISIIN